MDGKRSILGQEKHCASKQLLVELGTCLHFVKGNNDILEEDYVLISQRNSEATDNACQNIQKFGCTIEFVVLVNECKELLVDSLSNHFSSWDQFNILFWKRKEIFHSH